jgi:proline dehydrogenase
MFNRLIARILPFLPEKLVWIFSKKYIAGKVLDDAVRIIQDLEKDNISATIDILGESISEAKEVVIYKQKYLDTIAQLSSQFPEVTYSVKPTMFGLQWNVELCYKNLHEIIKQASEKGLFVRIDMEDSECTSPEIELFKKLYLEFPSSVGLVLQACLKRTMDDISYLNTFSLPDHPVNIRLCKGIYIEPETISYRARQDIRDNYLSCLDKLLDSHFFPAIATHDKKLIQGCLELIRKHDLNPGQYEFQMLLGVTPKLRKYLVDGGHRMRVYVPFGEKWFSYATRRLKENPHMVWDIITGIFISK